MRLVAATTGAGRAARLRFGLEFRLDPAWKIFWRTPGEAGLPPHVDWDGLRNVAAVAVRWPRPVRFSEYGITSWGYRRHVVLPLVVTPKRPGARVVLAGLLRYQLCKEICILGEATLSLTLPAGAAAASPAAAIVARFARRVPVPLARSPLSGLTVRAVRHAGKPALRVTATGRRDLPHGLRAIVEAPSGIRVSATAATRVETARSVTLVHPVRVRPADRALAGTPVTVTLLGDGVAVEHRTRVAPPAERAPR